MEGYTSKMILDATTGEMREVFIRNNEALKRAKKAYKEKHGEELRERARERYKNDENYRMKVVAKQKAWYAKKASEKKKEKEAAASSN